MIRNNEELAKVLKCTPEQIDNTTFNLEYVDYDTTVESDGFSVIVRTVNEDGVSNSKVIPFPFTEDYYDDVLSGLQCWADYMSHEGKGKHGRYEFVADVSQDMPVLLEDEIAEILEANAGKPIIIHCNESNVFIYQFKSYEESKDIVFKVYDALRHHHYVTVDSKNIIDL